MIPNVESKPPTPPYDDTTRCHLCGRKTGLAWDVHMILVHPETRPKPAYSGEPPKKRTKKR